MRWLKVLRAAIAIGWVGAIRPLRIQPEKVSNINLAAFIDIRTNGKRKSGGGGASKMGRAKFGRGVEPR